MICIHKGPILHESKSWYDMARKSIQAKSAEIKTDKDIVIEKYPEAKYFKLKSGFYIGVKSGKNINPVHSGIAKNESDAWKKAAHEVS